MSLFCIESCYWHLIEKRFCYDENIALYEDPIKTAPKQNSSYENLAYYDQVSVIAGRSIVTIDSEPAKPIESQPKPRKRWWEDEVEYENKKNEARSNLVYVNNVKKKETQQRTIPTIHEENLENTSRSMEDLDKMIGEKVERHNSLNLSASGESVVTMRKKSLHERRMSRSLTLAIIDRPLEIPIIRQQSMPKFYIDTPEPNQSESSILVLPSAALASPVAPRDSHFDFFDLKSVVQIENETRFSNVNQQAVPVHKQTHPQSRLHSLKEKLRPNNGKLKRHSSLNLPNSINHI